MRWQGVLGVSGNLIINFLVPTSLGSTCLCSACSHHLPPGWGFCFCGKVCIRSLWWGKIWIRSLWCRKICIRLLCISLEEEVGLYFIAELLFNPSCLTAFPLFQHSLTSLISNCLSVLLGTQGRPRRLNLFNKQGMGAMEGLLNLGGPWSFLLGSVPSFLWYSSTLRETEEGQERG